MRVGLRYKERVLTLDVRQEGDVFRIAESLVDRNVRVAFLTDQTLLLEIDGALHRVEVVRNGSDIYVAVGARTFTFSQERGAGGDQQLGSVAAPEIVAPMPGKVVRVFVKPGDEVAYGDTLFILEAMKMENRLSAEASGVVRSVNVTDGDLVEGGAVLAVLCYTDGEKP